MAAPDPATRPNGRFVLSGIPTWLAQPAALVPNSRLLDCPPHDITVDQCLAIADEYEHVVIHTSTPSLRNDCKVAESIKSRKPGTTIGFVGAHAAVLPAETLKASPAIDWVGRKEFDYTCKDSVRRPAVIGDYRSVVSERWQGGA